LATGRSERFWNYESVSSWVYREKRARKLIVSGWRFAKIGTAGHEDPRGIKNPAGLRERGQRRLVMDRSAGQELAGGGNSRGAGNIHGHDASAQDLTIVGPSCVSRACNAESTRRYQDQEDSTNGKHILFLEFRHADLR
jgi:hypothetical protein